MSNTEDMYMARPDGLERQYDGDRMFGKFGAELNDQDMLGKFGAELNDQNMFRAQAKPPWSLHSIATPPRSASFQRSDSNMISHPSPSHPLRAGSFHGIPSFRC